MIRMKKNVVSRYGMYRTPRGPMLGSTISSRMKMTNTSIRFPKPVGTSLRELRRAAAMAKRQRSTAAIQRKTTCLVIEASSSGGWPSSARTTLP